MSESQTYVEAMRLFHQRVAQLSPTEKDALLEYLFLQLATEDSVLSLSSFKLDLLKDIHPGHPVVVPALFSRLDDIKRLPFLKKPDDNGDGIDLEVDIL